MSFRLTPLVWENVCGDDATARLVLLWLAYRADDHGRCYPSVADIVRHTGLSRRCVQRALDRLIEADVVRLGQGVTREANPGGRSRSHNFHVNVDRLREVEPVKLSRNKAKERVSPVHPFNGSKGCQSKSRTVSTEHENGVPVTPEPVIEPVMWEPVIAPLWFPPRGDMRVGCSRTASTAIPRTAGRGDSNDSGQSTRARKPSRPLGRLGKS